MWATNRLPKLPRGLVFGRCRRGSPLLSALAGNVTDSVRGKAVSSYSALRGDLDPLPCIRQVTRDYGTAFRGRTVLRNASLMDFEYAVKTTNTKLGCPTVR